MQPPAQWRRQRLSRSLLVECSPDDDRSRKSVEANEQRAPGPNQLLEWRTLGRKLTGAKGACSLGCTSEQDNGKEPVVAGKKRPKSLAQTGNKTQAKPKRPKKTSRGK